MKLGAAIMKKLRRIFGKVSPSLHAAGEEDYYRILHFAEGVERMRRIAAELPFPGSTHRKEEQKKMMYLIKTVDGVEHHFWYEEEIDLYDEKEIKEYYPIYPYDYTPGLFDLLEQRNAPKHISDGKVLILTDKIVSVRVYEGEEQT